MEYDDAPYDTTEAIERFGPRRNDLRSHVNLGLEILLSVLTIMPATNAPYDLSYDCVQQILDDLQLCLTIAIMILLSQCPRSLLGIVHACVSTSHSSLERGAVENVTP